VHEAWSKLASSESASFADRQHFVAVCARAMRQVLIDHLRGKATQRRGGGLQRVTLTGLAGDGRELDLLSFSEALGELEQVDPRAADVVTLRVLGGLTVPEVALEIAVSPRTVDNLWRFSLAFFVDRLQR
jgi:RNA polymerase sigma factor (TIGR02999 family)